VEAERAPWRSLDLTADGPEAAPGVAGGASIRLAIGLAAAAIAAVGVAFVAGAGATPPALSIADPSTDGIARASAPAGEELVVQVAGAVVRPGVYRLAGDARLVDAIEAAGGYSPRVDAARAARELNLAARLADGAAILVPSRDDPPVTPASGGTGAGDGAPGSGGSGGRIDVNRASLSELDTLPGIGPVTAQKIVDARAEEPFASVDDLLARKVIGAATFEKIRDLITAS
jgi:competence protein ComEA